MAADGGGEEVEKLPSQTFHLVEKSCDWSVTKCKKKRVLKPPRQMRKRTFMDMLPLLPK
jgi:hypothetical protein